MTQSEIYRWAADNSLEVTPMGDSETDHHNIEPLWREVLVVRKELHGFIVSPYASQAGEPSPPVRVKIAMACLQIFLRDEYQSVGNSPLALL